MQVLPHTQIEKLDLFRPDKRFEAYLCLSTDPWHVLKDRAAEFLHPFEQKRLNSFSFEKKQQSFLLGRYCAKQALCAYLKEPHACALFIQNGVFDHPIVHYTLEHHVQISLSHSDEWGAAIAFPEAHPMAIDVENIHTDKCEAIRTQLLSSEQKQASCLACSESTQLTLLWTVKEAMSKTIRTGLMTPFQLFEVETIEMENHYYRSTFRHFAQYRALSVLLEGAVCSIICPKQTKLHLSMGRKFHG